MPNQQTLFKMRDTSDESQRLMDLLSSWHHIPVIDDQKNYNEMLIWCLEHCQSKFRDVSQFDRRVWYFENERDAAMFALKWA